MDHLSASQTTSSVKGGVSGTTTTTSSALGETPGGAGLSMNAREWRPGTSYVSSGGGNSGVNASTASTVSSSSPSSSWSNQQSPRSLHSSFSTGKSKDDYRPPWYNASTSVGGGSGVGEGAKNSTAASGNIPMNGWTGVSQQATSNMAWGGGGGGAAENEESNSDNRNSGAADTTTTSVGRTLTTSALPETRIWARAARHRGNGTTVLSSPGGVAPFPRTAASLGVGSDVGTEGWGGGDSPTDRFWRRYRDISADTAQQMDTEDPRHRAVPASFFCDAYPLCDADDESDAGAASLAPAASSSSTSSTAEFGYPVSTFRVTGRDDGRLYCLRRFDNCKAVSSQIARSVAMRWMSACDARTGRAVVAHPGLVRLRDAFVLHRAVFFVHDYHPMATATGGAGGGGGYRTLRQLMRDAAAAAETHRRGSTGGAPTSSASTAPPMPEPMIWSILVQLTSALRTVHAANLACRSLRLHRILCCPRGGAEGGGGGAAGGGARSMRVRINCVGIVDALEFESRHDIKTLQRQDLYALGRVLLSLMTGTDVDANLLGDAAKATTTATTADSAGGNQGKNGRDDLAIVEEYWVRWSAYLPAIYSEDLCMVLSHLLSRPKTTATTSSSSSSSSMENDGTTSTSTLSGPSIETLSSLVAPRAFDDLDASHLSYDVADDMLASTYECGRGLRLLMKLGYVNERPEFGVDRRWSETGDCYVLKLFRDYVFHQADEAGRPVMDVGHVIQSLNKLDAADEEKIVLVSRDGTTMMVVSFADVARCLEGAYEELCRGGAASSFSEMATSASMPHSGTNNNPVGIPAAGGGIMAGGLFIPPTVDMSSPSPSAGSNTTNNNGTTWQTGGGGFTPAPHSTPSPYQSPYSEYYHHHR